jgi:hypothetical protein
MQLCIQIHVEKYHPFTFIIPMLALHKWVSQKPAFIHWNQVLLTFKSFLKKKNQKWLCTDSNLQIFIIVAECDAIGQLWILVWSIMVVVSGMSTFFFPFRLIISPNAYIKDKGDA